MKPHKLDEDRARFLYARIVGADEAAKPFDNLEAAVKRMLATLTPREERVLRMRFGVGEKFDHTLKEVGQDFEVTRERIRQIEAKALRKLRWRRAKGVV